MKNHLQIKNNLVLTLEALAPKVLSQPFSL